MHILSVRARAINAAKMAPVVVVVVSVVVGVIWQLGEAPITPKNKCINTSKYANNVYLCIF